MERRRRKGGREGWRISLWPSSLICLLFSQPHLSQRWQNTANVITAYRRKARHQHYDRMLLSVCVRVCECVCVCVYICVLRTCWQTQIFVCKKKTTKLWQGQTLKSNKVDLKTSIWMLWSYTIERAREREKEINISNRQNEPISNKTIRETVMKEH